MRALWPPKASSHNMFADLRGERRRRWVPHLFSRLRRLRHDDVRGLRRCRLSILAVPVLLVVSLATSCIEPEPLLRRAAERGPVTIPVGEGENLTLPVTFSGDLPCKDCIARRVTLTLRPDTVFLARTVWLGDPEPNASYDLGRWVLDAARRKVTLKGGADGTIQLAMIDTEAIRMLELNGSDSAATGPATLVRSRRVERFNEPLRLRGLYLHTRGGPVLGECASRKRWPISSEAHYFVLERAYRAARPSAGTPLLVSVEARLALRPGEAGEREMVVVERVIRLWRDGDCRHDPGRPEPRIMPWRLVQAAA